MAHLAGVYIYPIKSLDPVSVSSIRIIDSGGLEYDRQFAMFDAAGKYVNGKKQPRVHLLRSHYDPLNRLIRIARRDQPADQVFHVDRDRDHLEAWLGEHFGFAVTFREDASAGFPDDPEAPGPTVISVATLREVASWFPGTTLEQMRHRFRANVEIGGVPPFWEDRLYTAKPNRVPFQIGDLLFEGNNPCRRCVVPPRHPLTGENNPDFVKQFMARREETLPDWAEKSRFDHYYRLSVNTLVPPSEVGKTLRVGDPIRVMSPVA
jgi:uncharacterized protein YcbX